MPTSPMPALSSGWLPVATFSPIGRSESLAEVEPRTVDRAIESALTAEALFPHGCILIRLAGHRERTGGAKGRGLCSQASEAGGGDRPQTNDGGCMRAYRDDPQQVGSRSDLAPHRF